MNVSHGLDMGIKVLIIALLLVVIIVIVVTWWNWIYNPSAFFPNPQEEAEGLGGFINQINDILKKFFGG